eukprot:TRINITY_DN49415_c0_g1_i1.p1 TRINITY_DN49415_c0_g1~~TRINITY_DN49415_c0_g1_i1.p1  ORF type:complete len:434 (+),score=117.32 TRINITY_DN49415_c0_g1_i1:66-1367(+)
MAPSEEQEPVAETQEEPEVSDEGWEDWENMMEGKIRKKTTKAGAGDPPDMERDVRCSFKVFQAKGTEVLGLLQDRRNMRYRIGEGEAVPALELSLRHMLPGEEAEVFAISRMCWGPVGLPAISNKEKEIPPDADLRFSVILHEVIPKTPTDKQKKMTAQDWRDKVAELTWRKENGNDHFKRKNFVQAAKCYDKGMEIFPEAPIIAPMTLGRSQDGASAAATLLVAETASNLAAVLLEQGKVRDSLDSALITLDLCPKHTKGLYRAAKAAMQLGQFKDVDTYLEQLVPQSPEDPGVKRLVDELARARQKHAAKEKRMSEKLIEAVGGRPEVAAREAELEQKKKDREEAAFEFSWRGMLYNQLPKKELVFVGLGLVLVAMVICFLSPRQHLRSTIMGCFFGVVILFAMASAVMDPPEDPPEKDEKKDDRRRKKLS